MSIQIDEAAIIQYYRSVRSRSRPSLPTTIDGMLLTNTAQGLGDTVILTSLPRAAFENGREVPIFSQSQHFSILTKYNPFYKPKITPFWASADPLVYCYNLGNGHFMQRLHRAWGLPPDLQPHGCVELPKRSTPPRGVILHFEPGSHVAWQRLHVHPRAREIYPETFAAIQHFIVTHSDMCFFEIGTRPSGLYGVEDCTGLDLEETLFKMESCEFFLGIMSGPLHLAAALGLKIITIVNFPQASQIVLPVLIDVDVVESQWLYPQSVILHQDQDGILAKRFSYENLVRAFAGEIYPYWSDRYLPLLLEKI